MTVIHVILMQAEGEQEAVGCDLVKTPMGVPLLGPLSDEMRMYAANLQAAYPDVRYTICQLVTIEEAARVH